MITVIVLYTIIFHVSSPDDIQYYADEEQENGIKNMLVDQNLDKIQKEIFMAYNQNDLLKFESEASRKEKDSPERTVTDNSEKNRKYYEDRNSFFPISEIGGEKSVSNDFNNSLRNDLLKRSSKY